MRVALLAYNAPLHNAVGNQIAEKVRFFQERGAEVRLFVQDMRRLNPDVHSCAVHVPTPGADGPEWDYLRQADLIFAVYAQYYDLLQYLPRLAGSGPRIVFDYHGVTPLHFWGDGNREGIEQSARQRGYVWCADHALATSQANRRELVDATHFPRAQVTILPLPVDLERFHPKPNDRFLQQKLGISGPIVLYVGRLAANKRVPLLIEGLARLRDPRVHAVIVGDCSDVYAEEAARCVSLAQQLRVADRVHLIGELTDVDLPRAYCSADVLVMPSLHEGFCVPVIEAMASGCPVIVSRSAALPETVGDAGLTFTPNDADDLARQLQRVLDPGEPIGSRSTAMKIAVVSFRFGPEIVGGAETSLRTMAQTLQDAGHDVEVFTTCTISESNWRNDLPAGNVTFAGLTVHRFPVDPHDSAAHGEIIGAILEAEGAVSPELADRYLAHSIHSSALLEALRARRQEFDAIVVGPYLFGLTADIVREFRGQTLLVPCFHDEALARLPLWPRLYGDAGGILFHSVEEQEHAQTWLGVNHPNTAIIGTCLPWRRDSDLAGVEVRQDWNLAATRPYVVYCGRYSEQKNVSLLIDWARRYQAQHPGRLDFVFMGQGDLKLPDEPWLHDLGFVNEQTKHEVLAGARALVQLSRQESLSLVALEAWAAATPIVVHRDCAVLVGQIERSQGGAVVSDYETFAAALDDLLANESTWRQRGANGRAFVSAQYASPTKYVGRIASCIARMRQPLWQLMRESGLRRAETFSRTQWQNRFAEFVERVLTQPPRPYREVLRVELLRSTFQATAGAGTLLLPIRLTNDGTHAATPEGPGRTVICCEIRAAGAGRVVVERDETSLPALLLPGHSQVAAVPVVVPAVAGEFMIRLWMNGAAGSPSNVTEVPLTVTNIVSYASGSCASSFLDTVAVTLPKAHQLQQLPADYVDVTEGSLAPAKRFIKRKLLHNFKHAYVDVLSRQQSQVNGHLVLMIQQLAECCAMLDHAVTGLHDRINGLEAKIESVSAACNLAVEENPMSTSPQVATRRSHG